MPSPNVSYAMQLSNVLCDPLYKNAAIERNWLVFALLCPKMGVPWMQKTAAARFFAVTILGRSIENVRNFSDRLDPTLFPLLFLAYLDLKMSGQISASKAKRLAARAAKAEAKGKGGKKAAAKAEEQNGSVDQLDMNKASINVDRTATGVYTSQERSRDIKIESYSLNYHGRVLIDNATIELNFGRRYGLVGANGSGKSTFLRSLAERDIEIPPHIDVSRVYINL